MVKAKIINRVGFGCQCGCKGKHPHHKATYTRVVRLISQLPDVLMVIPSYASFPYAGFCELVDAYGLANLPWKEDCVVYRIAEGEHNAGNWVMAKTQDQMKVDEEEYGYDY